MKMELAKSAGASLGFGVLWTVLAGLSPTTTYHLAPAIVAGVGVVLAPGLGWLAVTSSLAISLGFVAALDSFGWLAGESLLPVGGAATESVVAAVGGAALAWVSVRRWRQTGRPPEREPQD